MKKILVLLFIIGVTTSCKEEKLNPNSVFADKKFVPTELESYIIKNYTEPYNISILYKYDDMESDQNYKLSPSTYESSVRLTRLVKHLCIEPYDKVTGSKEFIKKNFPKIVNYIGSPAYRNNGTMLLGTAEGGRKITLYFTNWLDSTTATSIEGLNYYYFHTIHHEFAHILQQTRRISPAYQEISKGKYVLDSWNSEFPTVASAVKEGFISPYASKDSNEDFVEVLAFYVTLTPEEWKSRVALGGANGQSVIAEKLNLVRAYYDSWGIDIDALRDEVNIRQANLSSFDQTKLD